MHFAPRIGWINDPLDLTYHDGSYHLYLQHLPDQPEWSTPSAGDTLAPLTWPTELAVCDDRQNGPIRIRRRCLTVTLVYGDLGLA